MGPCVAEAGGPGVATLVHVARPPAPLAPRVPPLEGAGGARRPLRVLRRAPRAAPTSCLLGAAGVDATASAPALLRPARQRVGGVRETATSSAFPVAPSLEVPRPFPEAGGAPTPILGQAAHVPAPSFPPVPPIASRTIAGQAAKTLPSPGSRRIEVALLPGPASAGTSLPTAKADTAIPVPTAAPWRQGLGPASTGTSAPTAAGATATQERATTGGV